MCNKHNRLLVLGLFSVFYRLNNNRQLDSNCACEDCAYYDMQHKNMRINREKPDFEQIGTPLGIDNTGHAEIIRARLQLMFS